MSQQVDTKLLAQLNESPISIVRILLGTIIGLVVFVGGTVGSLVLHIGLIWIAICALFLIVVVVRSWQSYSRRTKKGVQTFVQANNMQPLTDETMKKLLPPSVKDKGMNRKFINGYALKVGTREVCIFDYWYEDVDRTAAQGTHLYGMAVIKSSKTYPYLYLDGQQNGRDYSLKSAQKLDLEGDFNSYFHLYSEKGRQIESLSLLTPDIMQKLIDTARMYDIEVWDNNVCLITEGTSIYYKSNMDRLLICLEAMLVKID